LKSLQAFGSFALIAVRAHLPGYGRLHVFKNAAIRTGVYSGIGSSMVLVTWLVVANRAPSLEPFALERNLAAAVVLSLFAAVPVIRFLRLPGPLLAAGLIAWSITALTYRLLEVYFGGLAARYSAVHLFTLGIIIYMIFATLSWIGTCISRARESNVSR
jgi:uncharacterized membrane protein YvlD (DUF360 family)